MLDPSDSGNAATDVTMQTYGAHLLGAAAALVGLVVMIGWGIGSEMLKSVLPGFATMKFNTAFLFLLLGLSLLTIEKYQRLAHGLAAVTVLVSGLTIVEYLFGWNIGIDELIISDTAVTAAGLSYPGRMSVITAVSFFMCGVALIFYPRNPINSQLLSLSNLALAGIALVGYLYNAESLSAVFPYSTMAVHTAGTFILIGISLLLHQKNSSLVKTLFSRGITGIILRNLLPVILFLPLVLGWLLLEGQSRAYFDVGFGTAISTIVNILVLLAVIGWMTRSLNRIDEQRIEAEETIRRSNEMLEQHVQERTAELLKVNKALQASEARFSEMIDTAHDAIITVNAQQEIKLFNQGAVRIFGYEVDEVIGRTLDTLLPGRFQNLHTTHIATWQHQEQTTRVMAPDRLGVKGRRKNGEEFPAEVSISSLFLEGERSFTAVVRDVTQKQQARAALMASEQRFRLMIKNVRGYAIYMLDPQGYVASWNEGAQSIKGYSEVEIVGQHFSKFFPPEAIAQQEPQRVLDIARREGDHTAEGWRLNKEGCRFWVRAVITAVRDNDGKLLGFSKVIRDLTEHKKAEESLRKSEELLRQVLEVLPVGVWITDGEGVITQGNPAGLDIWRGAHFVGIEGYGEYKGWWADTGEPIEPDEWAVARAVTKGETSLNEEVRIECFDGSYKYILNSAVPIQDEENKIIGAIIVNTDITGLKEVQLRQKKYAEALRQSNLELESFAFTASHDLQEPLRKIQAFGDRLQIRYSNVLDEKGQDYLQRMISASARMRTLIRDLLTYSRVTTQGGRFKPVKLADVLEAVFSDLEVAIKAAEAQINVAPLIEEIDVDPVQIGQLLQNLLSNALKFCVPERPLIIEISGRMIHKAASDTNADDLHVPHYELQIADNGIGFDNKYAERIMGVFQRLHGRSAYEGTGIGLAICQKIVERHHGTISAYGVPNEGATFTIVLPIHQAELESATS